MIEGINITAYYAIAVILYIILVKNFLYFSNTAFRNFAVKIIAELRKTDVIHKVMIFVSTYLVPAFRRILSILTGFLYQISIVIERLEEVLTRADKYVIAEPFNLTALVIRKLYGENEQFMLAAAAGVIVVFYFILTIF